MSTIYGNPLLLGGGGVKLNIDYGTNPPSDTTKLWVPRMTAPSSVEAKYEFKFGNEQLAVDNYNYIPNANSYLEYTFNCKVNNYIYFYCYVSPHFQRYDMNSGIWETLPDPTNSTGISGPYCRTVGHLVVGDKIYIFGGRQAQASYYKPYVFEYDTTTNTLNKAYSSSPTNLCQGGWIKSGDIAYGFGGIPGSNNQIAKYDFNTQEITNITGEFTFDTSSLLNPSYSYYPFDAGNGIYYLLPLQDNISSNSTMYIVKVDIANKTVSKYVTIGKLFPMKQWGSVSNGTTTNYPLQAFNFLSAGITQIGSTGYIIGGRVYYGGIKPSPYIFKVNIVSSGLTVEPLNDYLFTTLNSNTIFTLAQYLDNKIHITQNYCNSTDTTYRNNQTLTLYSPLDNNKLFLQTGFGNNKFNIVNDKKAKVEIAINNAFIGNSENKADEIDAYLYSDSKWKNIKTGNEVYALKGNLISMDLDGNGDKQYRVLKINGSKAMVLGMSDISTSQAYNTTSKTGTFTNGTTGQLYAGSDLDTYLNTTWYNTLTAAAKAAIVPESRTQYIYQYYDIPNTPNTPTYTYQYQYSWSGSDYDNANLTDSISIGDRNVFALDLKDIFDYFGKVCITSNELMELWTNQTSAVTAKLWWVSSAYVGVADFAWDVDGDNGGLGYMDVTNARAVRPAFTIDLSKIPFTRV